MLPPAVHRVYCIRADVIETVEFSHKLNAVFSSHNRGRSGSTGYGFPILGCEFRHAGDRPD